MSWFRELVYNNGSKLNHKTVQNVKFNRAWMIIGHANIVTGWLHTRRIRPTIVLQSWRHNSMETLSTLLTCYAGDQTVVYSPHIGHTISKDVVASTYCNAVSNPSKI